MKAQGAKRLVYLCDTASDGETSGVIRPVALTELARRAGYRAIVITSTVSNKSQVRSRPGLTRVNKVAFLKLNGLFVGGNGPRRALNMAWFAVRSSFVLWRLRRKSAHSVVLTSSTGALDSFAGLLAQKLFGYRWVTEVRDVWPDAPMQLQPELRSYGFYALAGTALKCALKYADAIVSPLENIPKYVTKHAIRNKAPFLHIPNCAYSLTKNGMSVNNGTASAATQAVRTALNELRSLGRPIVAYFGSMNTANGIERLFSLFAAIPEHAASFLFVGNGAFLSDLKGAAETKSNIRVCSGVPREDCKVLMGMVDILAFGIPALPVYEYGLSPIKLSESLHAGKPVFYWGAPCFVSDNLEDSQAIVSVSANDMDAAAAALSALVSESSEVRAMRGVSASNLARKRFQYDAYEASFAELLDRLDAENWNFQHKEAIVRDAEHSHPRLPGELL